MRPRLSHDRERFRGRNGEPRLPGELRLPCGIRWWVLKHVGTGRPVGRPKLLDRCSAVSSIAPIPLSAHRSHRSRGPADQPKWLFLRDAARVGTMSSAVGASLYRCSRRRRSAGQTTRSRDDSSWILQLFLRLSSRSPGVSAPAGGSREPSVSTSYCARQRVVQFLSDRSPGVSRRSMSSLVDRSGGGFVRRSASDGGCGRRLLTGSLVRDGWSRWTCSGATPTVGPLGRVRHVHRALQPRFRPVACSRGRCRRVALGASVAAF